MTSLIKFSTIIAIVALSVGCNTAPVTRSPGAPGSTPPPSTGSSGPPVQVEAPGMPGLPSPGSAPGTGDLSGPPPVPGTVSLPAPQAGSTSAGSGDASSPTGSTSAGADGREQTEDEILAEALAALERRASAGQQQGEAGAARGSQAGPGGPAVTDAEKRQALDQALEQGFAEFDRVMLSERQAGNERADQEGSDGFSEDDAFASASDSTAESVADPLQTALVDSDPASVKGERNISTSSHSQAPPDLADAGDDDIIARQLREAAMKEQDPELRKKLWDEYRKYKRDLR